MVSEHSLVEFLGPPPPAITPEQEATVRAQIDRRYPADTEDGRSARHTLTEILFGKISNRGDSEIHVISMALAQEKRWAAA